MNEKEIFNYLFEIAKTSKDKEGVVAACLVQSGKIIIALPSSDDGKWHAEYRVIEKTLSSGIAIKSTDIIYSTVEPCGQRSKMIDCSSYMIEKGVKNICYAAADPSQHEFSHKKFLKNGINIWQTKHKQIIEKARGIFNSTMVTPGKYKI